jgi:HlyD family secretion protein
MKLKTWLVVGVVALLVAGVGFLVWQRFAQTDVPEGFAFTHGRAEATKIYITTKYQARIADVLVREGDTVDAGQVVARMDTRTEQAQLRQAQAQIQQAKDAKAVNVAMVAQREAELKLATSQHERVRGLLATGAATQEEYDTAFSNLKTSGAALEAAKSQVIAGQAAIDAATAEAERLRVVIEDGTLVAPRRGRIQYRLAEPGEVLAAGGRVLDMIDLADVYMTFYLPEGEAGRVSIGAEARIIFDAIPNAVVPATIYFVAAEAQFTPKTVETREERQKLAFQVRARIDPALLKKYEKYVKTGLPGVIYVRLNPAAEWPERLHVKIPEPRESEP